MTVKQTTWLVAVAAMSLCSGLSQTGRTLADEEQGSAEPTIQLDVILTDGSRIVGVPGIATFFLQTDYAKVDMPLKHVLRVTIGEDHEIASVVTRNGDRLTGVIDSGPIELETVFGSVSVGVEHIKEFSVTVGGEEETTLSQGPALHPEFGRDEDGNVIDSRTQSAEPAIYVSDTKWLVGVVENGRKVGYHGIPWQFSADGTVRAGSLWRGVWQQKSADTVSVVIMHSRGVTDTFDIRFKNPSEFTAYKDGEVYRYAFRQWD